MPDENPENIVLRYLRQIDAKVDRLSEDMRDVKHRLSTLEETVAGQSRRMDRVEDRLDRIERRLDLAESPAE